MPAPSFRRLTAAAAATALLFTVTPPATAAPASDENISREHIGVIPEGFAAKKVAVPMACRARSPISVGSTSFTISRIFATAVAPEKPVVGETQPIRIMVHPLNITVPDLPLGGNFVGASRISIDLRIPDGLQLNNPRVENLPGVVGGFTVFTVNEAGAKDPAGRILRLASDNNATVGHSPNSSMNSVGGANVPAGEDGMRIVLPSIVADATPTARGVQNISLNTNGAAGNFNDPHNFMTLLIHVTAPVVGDVFVPVMCSPRKDPQSPLHPEAGKIVQINAAPGPDAPPVADEKDTPEGQQEDNPGEPADKPSDTPESETDKPEESEEQTTEAAASEPSVTATSSTEAPAEETSEQAPAKSADDSDDSEKDGDETNFSMRLDRIFLVPAVLLLVAIAGVVFMFLRKRKKHHS